jgi:hypothetical protein
MWPKNKQISSLTLFIVAIKFEIKFGFTLVGENYSFPSVYTFGSVNLFFILLFFLKKNKNHLSLF